MIVLTPLLAGAQQPPYRDENYMMSRYDPEVYTRTHIVALTGYLNPLQSK